MYVSLIIFMKSYCEKGAQLWVITIAQDEAAKRHNLACFCKDWTLLYCSKWLNLLN